MNSAKPIQSTNHEGQSTALEKPGIPRANRLVQSTPSCINGPSVDWSSLDSRLTTTNFQQPTAIPTSSVTNPNFHSKFCKQHTNLQQPNTFTPIYILSMTQNPNHTHNMNTFMNIFNSNQHQAPTPILHSNYKPTSYIHQPLLITPKAQSTCILP